MEDVAGAAGNKASEIGDKASELADRASDKIQGKDTGDKAQDKAEKAGDKTREAASDAKGELPNKQRPKPVLFLWPSIRLEAWYATTLARDLHVAQCGSSHFNYEINWKHEFC